MTATASAAQRRNDSLRAPSALLLLSEGRGLNEFATSLALAPLLRLAPRGDGHPVLALPGFLAGDVSTWLMRRYLRQLGYRAEGWELGRNIGGFYRMRAVLRARLARLRNETGRKVSLVGWSLGGVFARDLALTMPEAVRSVITLGSPFARELQATHARRLYEQVTGEKTSDARAEDLAAIAGDLPVPATSIYTKTDGVVNWRCSIAREGPTSENIEILLASHIGLGGNAAALWAIADRLAQKEGEFKPFGRSGPFAIAYGKLTSPAKETAR
jgi:pimeloyl-ACP methyl ester carboxylesterase